MARPTEPADVPPAGLSGAPPLPAPRPGLGVAVAVLLGLGALGGLWAAFTGVGPARLDAAVLGESVESRTDLLTAAAVAVTNLGSTVVLSGGASHGAIGVGMLRALYERGIAPDLIIGTSAGAFNGAFIASRPPTVDTVATLAEVWQSLHERDVFPARNLLTGFLGFVDNVTTWSPTTGCVRCCAAGWSSTVSRTPRFRCTSSPPIC